MKYNEFVDYSKLDPIKIAAMEKFAGTLKNPERFGVRIVRETLGEPAIAIDFADSDYLLAFNVEGLGTKNLIADSMARNPKGRGAKYFESIGIDTVAMSTNDLSSIGAQPVAYGDIISSGDSNWFSPEKAKALLEGYRIAAMELGMAIPCGETPTLKGVVLTETLDLGGSSIGIIRPKTNLVTGQNLQEGDIIIGLESSGIHSNGVSLARAIAEKLPDGYFTRLPSGKILGEELLKPTLLYTSMIMALLEYKIGVHYIAPITGHGWKKIMRAKKKFRYEIDLVPPKGELFKFLQEKADLTDNEAYYTWNMGVGCAIMVDAKDATRALELCKKTGLKAWNLGRVERGEKTVIIRPLEVEFADE